MRLLRNGLIVSSVAVVLSAGAHAQELAPLFRADLVASLPDAPSVVALRSAEANLSVSTAPFSDDDQTAPGVAPIAKKHARTIKAGQTAQPLGVGDKLAMAALSQTSLFSIVGPLISAGISQANDSRPHYGTDAAAFGERFGAAEARNASLSVFSTGILSSALREDPRYYVLGPGHSFGRRIYYAATRVLITKTDGGSPTPNLQLMGGIFGANALTMVYYPSADTDASRVVTRSLTSIATRMGTNQLREFGAEIRSHLPHKK